MKGYVYQKIAWKHAKWKVREKIDRLHLGLFRKGNAMTLILNYLKVPVNLFVFLLRIG